MLSVALIGGETPNLNDCPYGLTLRFALSAYIRGYNRRDLALLGASMSLVFRHVGAMTDCENFALSRIDTYGCPLTRRSMQMRAFGQRRSKSIPFINDSYLRKSYRLIT
jgi:hypothetical protein